MAKSLLDHAFDYVEAHVGGASFNEIWAYVCESANLTEEVAQSQVARFYTNLMLDGRFVTLGENVWDLRIRNTYSKAYRADQETLYADTDVVLDEETDEEIVSVDGDDEKSEDSSDEE